MIDQYFDYNKLNELASQFKKQYIKYCRTHDSLFSKIKELLSKIPIKAKEIYYKEHSHPNNPRIIEIIYINSKTGAVCVDCDDEILYGTALCKLLLNRQDLLNIIKLLENGY